MVSTTRPMSCLTLRSRSGVPICPRKYFETTMLVACCDQKRGISTSRCSKTTWPFSLPMTADRGLPFDFVERIDAVTAEEALEFQPGVDVGSAGWVVVLTVVSPPAEPSSGRRLRLSASSPPNKQ